MRFYVEAPIGAERKCGIVEAKHPTEIREGIKEELGSLDGVVIRIATRKDEEWMAQFEPKVQRDHVSD